MRKAKQPTSKHTTLSHEELNRRCAEVFDLEDSDVIHSVLVDAENRVLISLEETTADGTQVQINYEPNMRSRPTALAYIMGERSDFND